MFVDVDVDVDVRELKVRNIWLGKRSIAYVEKKGGRSRSERLEARVRT